MRGKQGVISGVAYEKQARATHPATGFKRFTEHPHAPSRRGLVNCSAKGIVCPSKVMTIQGGESAPYFLIDIFGIAEPVFTLPDPDGAGLACPFIEILA